MTGAYAHDWPGRGAWATFEERGRCGSGEPDSHEHGHGRHGGGRHGGGRHSGRHGYGRGPGRGEFPIEALGRMLMNKGRRHGPLDPEDLEHLEQMIALRRMRGKGRSPFGPSPRGRRGRRRRGDVRLAVLRLLAEEPRNGYQLMQTLEERSQGEWRPSPGSMYPTLSQLEDEGLIRAEAVDGGRRFHITDAGRADLESRAGEPDPWTPAPDADEHAMTELGPLVMGIGKAVWQVASVGDERQRAQAIELLAETQRRLYGILAQEPSADAGDDDDTDTDAASDHPDEG